MVHLESHGLATVVKVRQYQSESKSNGAGTAERCATVS
jgi:hypothetical protein